MPDEKNTDSNRFDPMGTWREMRDSWLESWAKIMVDTVNTDAYAKATGGLLNSYLTASTPMREAMDKIMLSLLAQFSMPSRADVVGIAERMTNLEMRLDDMDAKLDRIEKSVAKPAAAKPSRAGKKGGQ
jgi:hypothetical protein